MNVLPFTQFVRRNVPFVSVAARWAFATRDSLSPTRSTYSQNGEDHDVFERLRGYDLLSGIYVDVGANQPTKTSNTYLFYRHGCRGVLIEPNHDLVRLIRTFRRRDIVVPVGCADEPGVLEFRHSNASVFGTFTDHVIEGERWSEFLPVLSLDNILNKIPFRWIFYLSIDVEGLDFEVLRGATATLAKTFFVTIEYKSNPSAMVDFLQEHQFKQVTETPHNFGFQSQRDFSEFRRSV